MKATLTTITPEIALEMLNLNTQNRPLTEANIVVLAKEIKNGRWKVNGDMIRISVANVIIDGQHRLHAVVRTGITLQSWVMTGLPDDVFNTIDTGKRRSGGDTLGCRGEKNAHRLSAALILIDKYMTGRVEKSCQYSNTEVEALLAKYPDARESLITTMNFKGLLLPSVIDTCHYLFSKKDPAMTAIFMEKIFKGVGLEEGEPWYVLRERLMLNTISKAKLHKNYTFALCVLAWNHARAGRRIKILKLVEKDGKLAEFPRVK